MNDGTEAPAGPVSLTRKRKLDVDVEVKDTALDYDDKRMKYDPDAPRPPTTKRPTLSSLKVQLKKLKAPFRCPVVDPSKAASGMGLAGSKNSTPQKMDEDNAPGTSKETTLTSVDQLALPKEDKKIQHRTTRASLQFKSPLLAGSASNNNPSIGSDSHPPSGVRLTPTIQALQRQLQNLKRAVKVKQANEEAELKALVKMWKEAAREVAWEVWEIYKERGLGQQGGGSATEFAPASWGWEEKKGSGSGSSWGWAGAHDEPGEEDAGRHQKEDADDGEVRDDTMGTMLRQMGVDPEVLGWDVEQDCFVDEE